MDDHLGARESKDFRVSVRVRNNHLVALRERHGLSQKRLSELVGISMNALRIVERYGRLPGKRNNSRHSTHCSLGFALDVVRKVAAYFQVEPESLYPPELHESLAIADAVTVVGKNDLLAIAERLAEVPPGLPAPEEGGLEDQIANRELLRQLDQALKTITPREEKMLRMRMQGATLREVADKFAITSERVRFICQKAIGKLHLRLDQSSRTDGQA